MMILGLLYLLFAGSSQAEQDGGNADINLMSTILNSTEVGNVEASPNITDTPKSVECVNKYDEEGVCVKNHWCNHLYEDDRAIIDIAFAYDSGCEFKETCCRRDRVVPSNIAQTIGKANYTCGQYNPNGIGLITQGKDDKEANFGEFPWNVAIFKILQSDEMEFSGEGSLIHPSVILTAAYRAVSVPALRVRAGEWDASSDGEIFSHQDRDVKDVLIHADFKLGPRELLNNIALLFLYEPVDLSLPHIGVVCLPLPNHEPVIGSHCLSSSWTDGAFRSARYADFLRRSEVSIMDRSTCERQVGKQRISLVLEPSAICGKVGQLRSGDAIVCPIQDQKDRYVQNGIGSWGLRNIDVGVFVNVAKFRNWIDENVSSRGYDPLIYSYTP